MTDDDEMIAECLHLVQEASIGLVMADVPMAVAEMDEQVTIIREDGAYQAHLHWDIVADREGQLTARPTLVVMD